MSKLTSYANEIVLVPIAARGSRIQFVHIEFVYEDGANVQTESSGTVIYSVDSSMIRCKDLKLNVPYFARDPFKDPIKLSVVDIYDYIKLTELNDPYVTIVIRVGPKENDDPTPVAAAASVAPPITETATPATNASTTYLIPPRQGTNTTSILAPAPVTKSRVLLILASIITMAIAFAITTHVYMALPTGKLSAHYDFIVASKISSVPVVWDPVKSAYTTFSVLLLVAVLVMIVLRNFNIIKMIASIIIVSIATISMFNFKTIVAEIPDRYLQYYNSVSWDGPIFDSVYSKFDYTFAQVDTLLMIAGALMIISIALCIDIRLPQKR